MNKNKFILILKSIYKWLKDNGVLSEEAQPYKVEEKKEPPDFEFVFGKLIEYEGWKSSDKYGGDTIFGITKRWYPEEVEKMRSMETYEEQKAYAKQFYHKLWNKLNCDMRPFPTNFIIFDLAVNFGEDDVAELIREFEKIKDITIYKSSFILLGRVMKHIRQAQKDKTQRKYLMGWLNRCENLFQFIEKEISENDKS